MADPPTSNSNSQTSSVCLDGAELSAITQDDQFRVVITSAFAFFESCRRGEVCIDRLLDDHQRIRRQPAALARGGERLLGEAAAIGRIGEHEGERRDRMHGAEAGGIAAEDARDAAEPEGLY